jgi:hypothetical protein
MKTIKNILNAEVKRVSDDKAEEMTKEGWDYCPKSEWKKLHSPKPEPKKSEKSEKSEKPEKSEKKREKKKSGWKKSKYQQKKDL